MYKDILDKNQLELLPLIKEFKRTFYLVGGTAIALQIGHRRSIDFDLFRDKPLNHKLIIDKIKSHQYTPLITRRVEEQINLVINNVKLTFFQYPFEINKTEGLDDIILMPALIDLAAMKAYALGRRSKWKDYVDLYFIITKYFSVSVISKRATEIFEGLFSEKQFRAQLCFFEDIDYTEEVIYMGKEISQKEIRNTLTELAVQF
ncbi:MAG: nucleotidyl transferase AbiEii/AbiGii toxin family protein [Bacteroidetes bacterium]|nr:nucleotidyl transferase AbiEii/AbiGii toxin family protein [Bacteroidota bacterium]